ncbi:hypothetical protein [Cellulomonas endometrii]|uniref:hypothetical protein n=1 Tax=Cellulomonas endometrii TaxID=3036301 RepID=UPI0024AC89F7|nr:hypothetical protein [Cellulomonas endometrii]
MIAGRGPTTKALIERVTRLVEGVEGLEFKLATTRAKADALAAGPSDLLVISGHGWVGSDAANWALGGHKRCVFDLLEAPAHIDAGMVVIDACGVEVDNWTHRLGPGVPVVHGSVSDEPRAVWNSQANWWIAMLGTLIKELDGGPWASARLHDTWRRVQETDVPSTSHEYRTTVTSG